ncbi:GAF domain-containing protein [Thiohalorhabdus sp.]|uniref:GAF domain-containing protein n=1 Tax=Thiohalorhabdus sp. TaxID=3094134 RepID=UPI002FC33A96
MPLPSDAGESQGNRSATMDHDLAEKLLEATSEVVVGIDFGPRIRLFNPAAESLFGFPAEEVLGEPLERLFPEANRDKHRRDVEAFLKGTPDRHWMNDGDPITLRSREGEAGPVTIVLLRGDTPAGTAVTALILDIGQKGRTESTRHRMRRALETVSAGHRALVRTREEATLLEEICRVAVAVGGYRFAWAGYAENDSENHVRPVAHAGHEAGYLDRIQVTWGDEPTGQGPVGRAIRSAAPSVDRDLRSSATFAPWREAALARSYESAIALPLTTNERTFGSLAIYAAEPDAFDNEEAWLLEQLAGDLAYGIQILRDRQAWRQERDHLVAILEATPDFVGLADRQGHILYRNAGAWQMLGMPGDTDPSGHHVLGSKAHEKARQTLEEIFPVAAREGTW